MPLINNEKIEAMRALWESEGSVPPQNPEATELPLPDWSPNLTPTQQEVFDCKSRYILCHGERGGGKTIGCLHKLVRHCYENNNAEALVLVGARHQATEGGAWHKLQFMVLPEWKAGIGLEYSESQYNTQHHEYMWIRNRFGGGSKILLISAPFYNILIDRIKGPEPSFVFVDEITTLPHPAYFTAVIQQISRRPGIVGTQHYIAATNPAGPSHWVYKRFFVHPKRSGVWDTNYALFHFSIEENKDNLPTSYYDNIREAVSGDPVEEARMLRGEWVDRPSGDAIYRDYFMEGLHLRGDEKKRLLPNPGWPIIMGYDLGETHNAIVFMQQIPTKDRILWLVFDEMVYIGRRIPYEVLMPAVVKRMDAWCKVANTKFHFYHISDDSAFNQYRPGSAGGSYDVMEVERYSAPLCERYGFPPIKMKAAPKFKGSVAARVRILMDALVNEEILISVTCTHIKEMFLHLESEKNDEFGAKGYNPALPFTPRESKFRHVHDALTYPILNFKTKSTQFIPNIADVKGEIFPMFAA